MEKIRRQYTFTGRVQGVGFRYNAKYAADLLGLTGWVSNDWDGRVTMEVQGTEEDIDRLILRLQSHRWIRIDYISKRNLPLKEENGFRVR
ncbi:MAG: acylphosphatase [Lachnospiraceae bacterium]|nr:acylphosphatase [Lachnospiraceae bacterium]